MEFIIRTTDGDSFDLPNDSTEIYCPTSVPCENVGSGTVKVGDCLIEFIDEQFGIQVMVEDKMDEELAEKLIQEVGNNIQIATGQEAVVVMLTGKQ